MATGTNGSTKQSAAPGLRALPKALTGDLSDTDQVLVGLQLRPVAG